jgi:hypothetical protein
MKNNFLDKLAEYKEYFLTNIKYDSKTNKVEYENFNRIDKNAILKELYNEFTKEFIQDLNFESFIRKLNNIMKSKKRDTKKRIREEFKLYITNLNEKIDGIRKETSK